MTTLLLLLACGAPPPWSDAAALAPTLAAMDVGGDGRVDEADYTRVAWSAPPFAAADADHDGALSTAELATLLDGQAPLSFDGGLPRGAPDPELGPGMSGTLTADQRHAWEVLHVLAAEARAAGRPTPTPAELDAAAQGGLRGAATIAMIAQLRAR